MQGGSQEHKSHTLPGCQALGSKTPAQPSFVPLPRLLVAHGIITVTVTGPALQVGQSTDLEIL